MSDPDEYVRRIAEIHSKTPPWKPAGSPADRELATSILDDLDEELRLFDSGFARNLDRHMADVRSNSAAVIEAWAARGEIVEALLDQHLDENGAVLPTLFMSEVARWVVAHGATQPETAQAIFEELENITTRQDLDLENLIDVGFLQFLRGDEPNEVATQMSLSPWLWAKFDALFGQAEPSGA